MDASTYTNGLADESLSERLKRAYERVDKRLRVLARRDFCAHFKVTDDSFRAKRSSKPDYPATLEECLWMEEYEPQIVPA
ncbi:hypothetical protein [Spirosoma jeollabukense]